MIVEPMNFSWLSVRPTDLSDLSQILDRSKVPDRFLALRKLILGFDDIPRPGSDGYFGVSEKTCAAHGAMFTSAIRRVLILLKEKRDMASVSHPGITLELQARKTPGKWTYGRSIYLNAQSNINGPDFEDPTSLRRAWLKLIEEPGFPVIDFVTTFRNMYGTHSDLFEMIWPPSWISLVSLYLRDVKIVEMYAFDDERKASKSREAARREFGLSMKSLPSTVTHVSLRYPCRPPTNHFFDPPRLTDPQFGYDVFSHELGALSQRLVELTLSDATINLVDFFSIQGQWPRLATLRLSPLQVSCADGTWYFHGDSLADDYVDHTTGDGDLDEMREYMEEDELPARMDVLNNPYRTAMDLQKFKDIYIAAANAVQRMPRLRKMNITFDIKSGGLSRCYHEFEYVQGTDRTPRFEGSLAEIKVDWWTTPAIEIQRCDEVWEAWREVGRAKGTSIELYFCDDYYFYGNRRLVA